ncbi:uncharacterized protein [Venturia canescens]|uniref:uncharacterized protein n=1 Tax=Venturia canescens TaxID=32260 RepID=UPI001C9C1391|nr:uncharacterized protein LOC122415374 [Venturia canescens]
MAMSLRDMCLLYDEQFNRKMKIAKFLVKHLEDKNEMNLAKKWLLRVSNIKSPVLQVKKNRNAFLSYMVKVLSDGVLTGCIDSEPHSVCDPDNALAFLQNPDEISDILSRDEDLPKEMNKEAKPIKFHKRWSKDHKTYVAVKPIPGRGALVYLATSKVPGLESWDFPNIKHKN